MENKSIDYLIEEVSKLREEIIFLLGQIEENERFALFGSGAVWALVASVKWNDAMNIVIWLPSIITFVFSIKRMMLAKTTSILGSYIKEAEMIISEKTGEKIGWENYWEKHKYEKSGFKKSYMRWWGDIFWIFLFLSNVFLATFFPFKELLGK